MLKEKEETVMQPERALGWLYREAASVKAVTKAGTFRYHRLGDIVVTLAGGCSGNTGWGI